MKKIGAGFAAFFLLLVISSSVWGGERKIRVVFTNWEPYGYTDNGKIAGFELDIFAAVMAKMDIKAEFHDYPWKRCLHIMKKGTADVIISVVKTPEREEFLNYPAEPISLSNSAFFTRVGSNIVFSGSYEDLKEIPVGVSRGFSYGPSFDSADLKKDIADDTKQVVKKLVKRRYDIAVGNTVVISLIAKKMGVLSEIRFLTPLVHSEKVYAGFSKAGKYAKFTDDFSKALAEFRKSSEHKEILKRYGVLPFVMGKETK